MEEFINGVSFNFTKIIGFLGKLPWENIVIGVVVPVVSAYISYKLAENSMRRPMC